MNKPTITQIHQVMTKLGMVIFPTPYSITLGGIRTKDNSSNKFNDWLFASYFDENKKVNSIILEGTTDAGLYYRNNPMSPKGTAIIQHSIQHRGCYQYQNPAINKEQRGHQGKEAFRQIANMKYWRDADRDNYLEFGGAEEIDINFTNGHDMGTLGNNVDKFSAGCWGSIEKKMDEFYKLAKLQISKGLGDKFSFSMLHENDFNQ
jgi:hypothetical protein